jgi:hypothetical protein
MKRQSRPFWRPFHWVSISQFSLCWFSSHLFFLWLHLVVASIKKWEYHLMLQEREVLHFPVYLSWKIHHIPILYLWQDDMVFLRRWLGWLSSWHWILQLPISQARFVCLPYWKHSYQSHGTCGSARVTSTELWFVAMVLTLHFTEWKHWEAKVGEVQTSLNN